MCLFITVDVTLRVMYTLAGEVTLTNFDSALNKKNQLPGEADSFTF